VPSPTVHGTYAVPTKTDTVAAGDVSGAAQMLIVEPKETLKWGYEPATLTVEAGRKILVTNKGRIPHTATSTTGKFDTGLFGHNKSAVLTIDEPGTYKLLCTPHPWMKATIIVTGDTKSAAGEKASAAPEVDPPSLNAVAVAGTLALIVAGVFGLAWFARRRPES